MSTDETSLKRVRPVFLIGLLLFVVTAWLFWPVTGYNLLIFDDDRYVTDNAWVNAGLSLKSVLWAFTTLEAEFWHPLTWVSYMLDASVYGKFPGGYHLTNLLLHAINTLVLFLALRRLTNALWPSALVAALFAWHPLHVETVAWVAERKGLLSAMFMFLTLLSYARFVEALNRKTVEPSNRTHDSTIQRFNFSTVYYLLALFFFALGLMSKPMVVTLPCVLLLLDYWPLRRFTIGDWRLAIGRLIWEKIPFFALSLAVGILTILAQQAGGSLKSVEQVPFSLRALNVPVAYAGYIAKTVWPVNLCIHYPLPRQLPLWPAVLSTLALAAISGLVWRKRASAPWAVVGWLWFLGILLPVIGILQVGYHAMADRYSYLPLVGLFLIFAWGIVRCVELNPSRQLISGVVAGGVLILCLSSSRLQLVHWRDSVSLFEHEVSIVGDNALAQGNLGVALSYAGRSRDAVTRYAMALALEPQNAGAHFNLGSEFARLGRLEKAELHLRLALKYKRGVGKPLAEELHNNLGVVLIQSGKTNEAVSHFKQAIQANPRYARPYFNYGNVLALQGQPAEAVKYLTQAARLEPDWLECMNTLADAAAVAGDFSNAITTAETAMQKATQIGAKNLAAELERKLGAFKAGTLPPPKSEP